MTKATPTLKQCQTMAVRLDRAATRTFETQRKKWKHNDKMMRMFQGDRADLKVITLLLHQGEVDIAFGRVAVLDTAVRDTIPKSVWNFVVRAAQA